MLRAEVNARIERTHYSEHATANEYLVGVISVIAALERQLRDASRAMPAARGALVIAIAGRTKSGKTTLRKALTREAGRTGIGRGAHRTTRQTSAFEIGSVTYLTRLASRRRTTTSMRSRPVPHVTWPTQSSGTTPTRFATRRSGSFNGSCSPGSRCSS